MYCFCQEWLTSLVEKSKAAGAKGARSKGPKGGKWTKEEVRGDDHVQS